MRFKRPLSLVIFSSIVFVGCAAYLVPATSDPNKKLQWAVELFDVQGRPLPAEGMIREAIETYTQNNDRVGLAEAYRTYGFFFRSRSVGNNASHYTKHGFLDKTATFETRYEKSIEYFEKSKDILVENEEYGLLTNVYLNMGFTYMLMNSAEAACRAYDNSLASLHKHLEANPNAEMSFPPAYASFEDFVQAEKEVAGCP